MEFRCEIVRIVLLGCVGLLLGPFLVCEGRLVREADGRGDAEGSKGRNHGQNDDTLPPGHMTLESEGCDLSYDPKAVKKLALTGTIHLIKYEFKFPEYETNPIRSDNTTYNHNTNVWYRVFSTHGLKLITMAFNYDALSLSLLTAGVESMTVPVVDRPPRCFGSLSESGQMSSMLKLIFTDLDKNEAPGEDSWDADKNFACHQMIKSDDGRATFVFRCCNPDSSSSSSSDRMKCRTADRDQVIDVLYVLLAVLKIAFVLFSPIVLQRLLFRGSTKKTSYVVPVMEERGLAKTILVKKVRGLEDETTSSGYGRRKDMKQFTRFRKLVKRIPSEAIVPVRFNRLDILVDHKELMAEGDVPVGLFRFVYDTFIRCGITQVEPLKSCCQESIFGSWSPRFLWLRLRKRCDCNRGCRDSCSWSSIFHFLGVVVFILLVPFPYYLRVGAFYAFENDEMKGRQDALDRLDLEYAIDHNIMQWLTPTHASFVTLYVIYLTSLLLLSALRICDSSNIDGIARACVTDMRNVRQSECLRMVFAHVLLPFEKFGVFGVLVAVVYWPIVLPLCFVVVLFYCVPLVYLTGRLLVSFRPACCRRKPLPTAGNRSTTSISGGVTSFDSCFFLDSISPDSRPYSTVEIGGPAQEAGRKSQQRNMIAYRQKLGSVFRGVFVGALMLLAVYSVLVMYAETFGFLVEIAVLSVLGAIVNSDRSVQYIVLVVWGLVYVVASCHLSYRGYYQLSRELFGFIKARLGGAIQEASMLRQDKRRNTAFKYFTRTEAAELRRRDLASMFQDEDDPAAVDTSGGSAAARVGVTQAPGGHGELDRTVAESDDSIEYRDNRLHWVVSTLVLFIDKNDVSRIPIDFFWEVCKLDMPGSPGPVYKAALKALGRILSSLLFLSLLAIVVLSLGRMHEITSTIQMLLVLVSGGIPLIVYLTVYGSSGPERSRINEYSLRGKVQRVILGFCQSWPVYDLSFVQNAAATEPTTRGDGMGACRRHLEQHPRSQMGERYCDGCGLQMNRRQGCDDRSCEWRMDGGGRESLASSAPPKAIDPMQVDLLITVKDEQEDDNIRSEPVSLGSGMSINSNGRADRISPDETQGAGTLNVYSSGQPTASGVTNQPTNATRSLMTESAEALQADASGTTGLRKQSSVSTFPLQNHVTTAACSTTAAAASTQADMVVDVTDDVIFVKRIGFASPRNTVSMRSLPSYKQSYSESTSESAL